MKLGPEERDPLVFMTQYLTVFPWPKSVTFGGLTVLNAGICAKCYFGVNFAGFLMYV